ncbi:hypothetical protein OYT13_15870 [Pandoraea sp. XJJ-1]|uniref:hypothetical protein n=1 Tax=Pandoraea sp. XJJ-1 TaxID=3002643 RepID=UPI002283220C|nr:hypothetical protein [Pandoraea sp. XJJ-1]WAL81329.1 hypothetical protein OYT13_15870 [Pandoraea sp. XJJ-1]
MDEPRDQKTVVPLKQRQRVPLPPDLRVPALMCIVACCGLIFAGWICVERYVV